MESGDVVLLMTSSSHVITSQWGTWRLWSILPDVSSSSSSSSSPSFSSVDWAVPQRGPGHVGVRHHDNHDILTGASYRLHVTMWGLTDAHTCFSGTVCFEAAPGDREQVQSNNWAGRFCSHLSILSFLSESVDSSDVESFTDSSADRMMEAAS